MRRRSLDACLVSANAAVALREVKPATAPAATVPMIRPEAEDAANAVIVFIRNWNWIIRLVKTITSMARIVT